jgi:dihydroxyacid dehydratase/phosphogluconate dehydratase
MKFEKLKPRILDSTTFHPGYLARRLEQWQQPAPRYTRGVLAKHAKLVSSASLGAMTDNLERTFT